MPTKKLIETALPIDEIGRAVQAEKKVRTGRPSALHMWWSRTSQPLARAVIFASLVDDPAEHPEEYPNRKAQDSERERLEDVLKALLEATPEKEALEQAEEEIKKYVDPKAITYFDPFVGGGSIPIEAQRLGLNACGADLNPVATIISKALTEIPDRFKGRQPIHGGEGGQLQLNWEGAEGLAEDIKFYGKLLTNQTYRKLKDLYPKFKEGDGTETDPVAWIWARTIKCPNPSCGGQIPLAASYDLTTKKGSEAWTEPEIVDGKLAFRIIHSKREKEKTAKAGRTAVFKCPHCGETTTDAYVREYGKNNSFSNVMMAVVVDKDSKHSYFPATEEQIQAAGVHCNENVPHGELPLNTSNFTPPEYGLTDYADLFTERQKVFLSTVKELLEAIQLVVEKEAEESGFSTDATPLREGGTGAFAYSQAIITYLAISVSKLLDRGSALTSWDSSAGGKIRNVFSRATMPMIWDFAETNPFSFSSGGLQKTIDAAADAVRTLPTGNSAKIFMRNAIEESGLKDTVLFTELPYYDKAEYANLSDFFYVWLRYFLHDTWPSLFHTVLTPKDEEISTFAYRWGGDKEKAKEVYADQIRKASARMYEASSNDLPGVIVFQYRRNIDPDIDPEKYVPNEWEVLAATLADSGFHIMASWPLGRITSVDIRKAENKGIPITIVVRKKAANAGQTTRRRFAIALRKEMPQIIEQLQENGVSDFDLRTCAVGRAWGIFTRYGRVLEADGNAMSAYSASCMIEHELDSCLNHAYSQDNDNNKEEVKDDG